MKRTYFMLWLLLSVALAIVTVVSFMDEISLGSHTFKRAPIAETLTNRHSRRNTIITISEMIEIAKKETVKIDTNPQVILIFGDSMSDKLGMRLGEYGKQNGHEVHCVSWDSSNLKTWAESDTLDYFIRLYKPTFIFVSLGSNEIYFPKPELRKDYAKKIIAKFKDKPYVWIGPPNWKPDEYGYNNMLAEVSGPNHFFLSDGIELDRMKDHIHPTEKASALWMDSIMKWIPKSAYPIKNDYPSDSIGKVSLTRVFLKAYSK